MAKDKDTKLGPSVTYRDLTGEAPVVSIAGVTFEDGESVDLVDELGEDRAAPILKRLSRNHYFDVDGSDAKHDEIREQVARAAGTASRRKTARQPTVKKSVAKQIEREDAEKAAANTADKGKPADDDNGVVNETGDEALPADVSTPDKPTLESRPRLPRARR